MSTDDRDTESANPSKSFKVGDFDRLSGFFTPVWESKKRIRSESPIPASSPVSSSNGSAARASKPTPAAGIAAQPAPPKTAAPTPPVPLAASVTAAPPEQKQPAADAPGGVEARPSEMQAQPAEPKAQPAEPKAQPTEPKTQLGATKTAPRPAKVTTSSTTGSESLAAPTQATTRANAQLSAARRAPTASALEAAASAPQADAKFEPAPELSLGARAAASPSAKPSARVLSRSSSTPSVVPTLAPGRSSPKAAHASAATAAPVASAAPRASTAALKQAGPNLPAEAFFDREPEFRSPAPPAPIATRTERGTPINHRSVRATVAATRVHEQLRARSRVDSLDTSELQRGTDTDREAALVVAQERMLSAGPAEDPHPVHLLRRLRRTIHLATPVPESVRAMIARYGRN